MAGKFFSLLLSLIIVLSVGVKAALAQELFYKGKTIRIVENMTGAGGLIAVNYLYNRAEPDGLTLGNWGFTYNSLKATRAAQISSLPSGKGK